MLAAIAVRTLAFTLAAIALCSGYVQFSGLADAEYTRDDVATAVADYHFSSEKLSKTGTPIRLLISSVKVNPVEHKLEATASTYVNDNKELPDLWDFNNRDFIDDHGVIKPKYEDLDLTIRVTNLLDDTTVPFTLPLSCIFVSYEKKCGVTIAIPVSVAPQNYPNDSYKFDLQMTAILPRPVYTSFESTPDMDLSNPSESSGNRSLPVIFGLAIDDQLTQWNLDTSRTASDSLSDGISVSLNRSLSYWTFVYAISAMPAVLGASYLVRMRRRHKTDDSDTMGAIDLAATLIALLTLREVFVPADIGGLTRLDLLLGIQLLGVCSLMAILYVRSPRAVRD